MPYRSIKELPDQVKALPAEAQRLFLKVVNEALEQYDEETAFKIAWTAVKKKWIKKDDKWVRKQSYNSISFSYQADLDVYDPVKRIARIYVIDRSTAPGTIIKQGITQPSKWRVTEEALDRALDSLVGKSLIAYPDHSGHVEVGSFIAVSKPDGYAVGLAEITDEDAWSKITAGEWTSVSPSVRACEVSEEDGVQVIMDFSFDHVAFVPEAAFRNARVLETYRGEECSLRGFSAALSRKLEEIEMEKNENRKMSEDAHDKELAEAKTQIEKIQAEKAKLEATNKNLHELLEKKTNTKYEAELAKMQSQIERLESDRENLQESLGKFEAERHHGKVQELLSLRTQLGFTPSNEDLDRFQAMTDEIIDQLIDDTKDLVERGISETPPRVKYAGGVKLDTTERIRMRLFGHARGKNNKLLEGV